MLLHGFLRIYFLSVSEIRSCIGLHGLLFLIIFSVFILADLSGRRLMFYIKFSNVLNGPSVLGGSLSYDDI